MQLSEHFSLREFACPCGCGRERSQVIRWNLAALCERRLEPIRAALGGHPMTIRSGVRCEHYNAKCDGAPHSQHLYGRAADVIVAGVEVEVVADQARAIIDELGSGGVKSYRRELPDRRPSFTHIDDRPSTWDGNRKR